MFEASRSIRAGVRAGAYAVVRGEEPSVFLAEDATVLNRLLAVNLVAQLPAADVSSGARLEEMRRALLEERWADALLLWMDETGTVVDVYDECPRVWAREDLEDDKAALEIRVAPLFSS